MILSTLSKTSFIPTWIGDFLVNISDGLAANPKIKAPNVDFADFTTFINYFKNGEGDVFWSSDGRFIKVYLYRKDLFENAEAKAAFRAQYGYGLEPAKTFGQYRDNAEFFTKFCADQDMECWGTTVQGHTGHPASTYEVLKPFSQVLVFITGESTWTTIRRLWKMVVS